MAGGEAVVVVVAGEEAVVVVVVGDETVVVVMGGKETVVVVTGDGFPLAALGNATTKKLCRWLPVTFPRHVSYTHLDVYKRQSLVRRAAPSPVCSDRTNGGLPGART